MKITIFGMGYVGVVSAACLLRDGHDVTGVDPVDAKVNDLSAGRSPVSEPGVAEMLAAGHAAGRLRATSDPAAGLAGAEMVWICVGTPSAADGSVQFAALDAAAQQIAAALDPAHAAPLIVLRSTVLPGTTRARLASIIDGGARRAGAAPADVVFHPEFLREGSAVADFDAPPKIVVGETRPGAADRLLSIYARYAAPVFRLSLEEAELVKYCDNLFHAVKVTFANEVGALARSVGVDARRVAEVFCADTKLNISPRYLRPGFAFGGSCLPKDLRAILREATLRAIDMPMLRAIAASNAGQIESFIARVLAHRPKLAGLVGLAFKPGTDDMRESPYVAVAKRLLGEGVALRIFDPGVNPARLIGANQALVSAALGHLERLLVTGLAELAACDAIIVNHSTVDAAQVRGWLAAGRRVFDLVGVETPAIRHPLYEGIAW
ncbi:MAG: nucleotide sugar dehydrogenase [Phycisphaerae bacterium]